MKKILSIMLSLVMVMALFTGCGNSTNNSSKKADDSSFFKECKKMQEIKTGTGEAEIVFDVKSDSILKDETLPKKFKQDGKVQGKLKVEATTESTSKVAIKISLQFLSDSYEELTTMIVDGSKFYMDLGTVAKFVSKIDAESGKQVEDALKQMGVTNYVSLNLNQAGDALGLEVSDLEKSVESFSKVSTKISEVLEKDFSSLQGKDGDDYTLTVNSDNADKAVDALVNFCDNSLKDLYTQLLDVYVDAFGADSQIGQMYAGMKNDTKDLDNGIKEIKNNKDKIVKAIKDSNANVVTKAKVTGEKGSREASISFETGEIKSDDVAVNCSITSKEKEGKVSIKKLIPTENVTDLTSVLTMLSSQLSENNL